MAHASMSGYACAHHQMDQDDSVNSEPCHSEQEQNQCDDCCCAHSHTIATLTMPDKAAPSMTKKHVVVPEDHHHSIDLSGLKRPPRL